MQIDMSQFHHIFFEECFEGLQVMERELLDFDPQSPNHESINRIFRAVHSMKGGSATFGFADIAQFSHLLETLLDEIRAGQRKLSEQIINLLLNAVDCLRHMVRSHQTGHTSQASEADSLLQQLAEMLGEQSAAPTLAARVVNPEESLPQDDPNKVQPGEEHTSRQWLIKFAPHKTIFHSGNEPLRLLEELARLGDISVKCVHEQLPDFEILNAEECHLNWRIELTTTSARSAIEEVFDWVMDECELHITPCSPMSSEPHSGMRPAALIGQQSAPQAGLSLEQREQTLSNAHLAGAQPASLLSQSGASIRVAINKVDQLLNLVGELVITQSMLSEVGQDFDTSKLEKLLEGLNQLQSNTKALQDSVMQIRMLPIGFAFDRLPRMVRDLAQQLEKKVTLEIHGAGTELDKILLEKIVDPLMHLVRNALDHGLELPGERLSAGKPETGRITVNAYHQGGNVCIEVQDDGAGIIRQKVLNRARQLGLVDADEEPTDTAVYELLFAPGFSTSKQVSEVSGRGVGMDVVKQNIASLNGSIEVESEEGRGTRFRIRLPLTLAILDGQLISIGTETFVLPLVSIVESVKVQASHFSRVPGHSDLYRIREEDIPVLNLHKEFGLVRPPAAQRYDLLIVVEGVAGKVALVVDDILAQQQVVIKSFENNYRHVDGIAGATILGSGRVALILDVASLVRLACRRSLAREGAAA